MNCLNILQKLNAFINHALGRNVGTHTSKVNSDYANDVQSQVRLFIIKIILI